VGPTLSPKETLSPSAFESEIALIIKEDADHAVKQLAGLRQILEYDLKPKPPRIIHDTYYDTEEDSLRARKITLRTRRLGGTLLISTKSDIRRISGNVIQRRERELPWGYDSVHLLAKILKLKVPTISRSRFQRIPVSRTLAVMGLQMIQDRRTRREARDVLRMGTSPTSILAELAIDRTVYTIEKIKIGFSEIEIEGKATGGLRAVREIANELLLKYQPLLQQWSYGKFLTGLAIRKLLMTKTSQRYFAKGKLKPGALGLISRTIQSEKHSALGQPAGDIPSW
jgi:inorganic triphosphatase YgiF